MKIIPILLMLGLLLAQPIKAASSTEKSNTNQYRHNVILVITIPESPKPKEIRLPWLIFKNGEIIQYTESMEGINISLSVTEISKDSVDLFYSISRNNGPDTISRFQISSFAEFKLNNSETISMNGDQAISLKLESK